MTFTVDDVKNTGTPEDPRYIVKLIGNVFGGAIYRMVMDTDGAEYIPYVGQEIGLAIVPL